MDLPKFSVGQKVKFISDLDQHSGNVLEISYNSNSGFRYRISSRYYDADLNEMVEGIKICAQDELVEVVDA